MTIVWYSSGSGPVPCARRFQVSRYERLTGWTGRSAARPLNRSIQCSLKIWPCFAIRSGRKTGYIYSNIPAKWANLSDFCSNSNRIRLSIINQKSPGKKLPKTASTRMRNKQEKLYPSHTDMLISFWFICHRQPSVVFGTGPEPDEYRMCAYV